MKILTENNELNPKMRRFALALSGILVLLIIPGICIFLALIIDNLVKFPPILLFPFNIIISIILFGFGFFWAGWSNVMIYREGEGSPVPRKGVQTKKLVVKGPYKYSRNPMVFGYLLIWLGLCFLVNSISLLIIFFPIIAICLLVYLKINEEKNLEKRFGEKYLEYKRKVSFVIPLPSKE